MARSLLIAILNQISMLTLAFTQLFLAINNCCLLWRLVYATLCGMSPNWNSPWYTHAYYRISWSYGYVPKVLERSFKLSPFHFSVWMEFSIILAKKAGPTLFNGGLILVSILWSWPYKAVNYHTNYLSLFCSMCLRKTNESSFQMAILLTTHFTSMTSRSCGVQLLPVGRFKK